MKRKPDSRRVEPAPPSADSLDFTPVPVRPRLDGWTPERQVTFIRQFPATEEDWDEAIAKAHDAGLAARGENPDAEGQGLGVA